MFVNGKKSLIALIFSAIGLISSPASCAVETATILNSGATLTQLTQQYPIHWISIEQVAESLKGKAPISIGFDIDDTLLFSSPAFFYGKQKFSPNSNDFLKNQKFWDEVSSSGWDRFSIPKDSGRALIELHLKRGDHIYFITGRPMPSSGKEDLTQTLKDHFKIPENQLNKVIFAGTKKDAKVEHMLKHNITIFYGDSDNDIQDAHKANAEGIRVLRPLNSTNKPMPKNGAFGEKVIVNSQY
ncbi:acid phosphatase AphA [Escherichia coli]|uniref:Class B acid phosphatase n=1 Tax=Escherichia coli TaxID=562 RepID=A0A7Z7L5F5_ECOLX|nr:acid phosphatase AphA [Escherichia coli]EHN2280685.1 acid phosphatase AphA [Shigella sonnei]EEW1127687.1 class B acid phosphatase [Escherichia coli]EEW1573850.1 class B acid phosphatase [Escherichia coli]EEW2029586.1 class B acid phosphatase [Escherichia coli]EEW2491322.1 class B acid phosphatase [Escherichia coli]